jgi:DNA-binding XRE family transcriptional regulator
MVAGNRLPSMLKVKEVRENHEPPMTQQELAALAGLSLRTIGYIEAGGDAKSSTLRSIAQALGVSVDQLFAEEQPTGT